MPEPGGEHRPYFEQQHIKNRAFTIIRNFRDAGRAFSSRTQLVPAILSTSIKVALFAHRYPEQIQEKKSNEIEEPFAGERNFITFIPYDPQTDTVSAPISLHQIAEKHPTITDMTKLYEAEKLTGILFDFSTADSPIYMQGRIIDYQLPSSESKKLFSVTVAFQFDDPSRYKEGSTNLTHQSISNEYAQLYKDIGEELGATTDEPFKIRDQQNLFMGVLSKVNQALQE